jgi:sterol desaturase/sphingolipid hydroxylase (fatty acid hydroxylase superfamily)
MERHAPTVVGLALALGLLSLLFGTLERLFPAVPDIRLLRRERLTDVAYWFFTPLVSRTASTVALAVTLTGVTVALGLPRDVAGLVAAARMHSPLASLPLGVQLPLALLTADLAGYWMHRAFHRPRLWRLHAIHHSARDLDWLAATRLHPLNEVLNKLAVALPVVLLGFDLRVFASVLPLLTLWALFLHANVPWGLGPLRYVVATPLFHRWHHSAEAEARDRNFAGLFPVLDWCFGTLHLPPGRQPTRFGVEEPVPPGLLHQLAYPFRK